MTVIAQEPARAVGLARPVWDALHSVADQPRTLSIAELCESLIGWDVLPNLLGPHNIDAPAGTLTATARIGVRHGDLHPGNVLIDNGHAVLIDFDSTTFAAGALDPVTMLISTLVHPDSPIRGTLWPDAVEITTSFATADFGRDHVCEAWFHGVLAWAEECRASEREFWALVLAYAARQLRYEDVLADVEVADRVVAIARRAVAVLAAS